MIHATCNRSCVQCAMCICMYTVCVLICSYSVSGIEQRDRISLRCKQFLPLCVCGWMCVCEWVVFVGVCVILFLGKKIFLDKILPHLIVLIKKRISYFVKVKDSTPQQSTPILTRQSPSKAATGSLTPLNFGPLLFW